MFSNDSILNIKSFLFTQDFSPASVGVIAYKSETKSTKEESIWWPIALIKGFESDEHVLKLYYATL